MLNKASKRFWYDGVESQGENGANDFHFSFSLFCVSFFFLPSIILIRLYFLLIFFFCFLLLID